MKTVLVWLLLGALPVLAAVGSAVVRGRVDPTQHVDRRHRACEPLAERPRQVHAILAPRSDLGDLRHRGHPGPRSDRGRARMARHGSLRHRGQGPRRRRAGRWPAFGAAHGDGEVAHRRSVSGQGPRRDPPGGRFGTARAWRGASTSRSSSRRRPARSPPVQATRSSTAASWEPPRTSSDWNCGARKGRPTSWWSTTPSGRRPT